MQERPFAHNVLELHIEGREVPNSYAESQVNQRSSVCCSRVCSGAVGLQNAQRCKTQLNALQVDEEVGEKAGELRGGSERQLVL